MAPPPSPRASSPVVKPPRGLAEAARKLSGLDLIAPSARCRRVKQAADDIAFAVTWAHAAATEAAPSDAGWLAAAVSELQRAECLLKALAVDAEREARRWEERVPDIRQLLERVCALYAQENAATTSGTPSTRPGRPTRRSRGMAASPRDAPPTHDEALHAFRTAVRTQGLRAGLAYLLGLTDYRYIGILRFEGGDPEALAHVDREHPMNVHATPTGLCSGCVHIRTRGGVMTFDELLDAPRAGSGRSTGRKYHSAPILDAQGAVLATLCLHDVVARHAAPDEARILASAAQFLAGVSLQEGR